MEITPLVNLRQKTIQVNFIFTGDLIFMLLTQYSLRQPLITY